MRKTRVAINGFGRIGRTLARLLSTSSMVDLVAINDFADIQTAAHLLRYDSVHGVFQGQIILEASQLIIGRHKVHYSQIPRPEELPWQDQDIDVVIECTGTFKVKEQLQLHLLAGAKSVILSAPAEDDRIKTIVFGINDQLLQTDDQIISLASCTTNNAAPMIQLVDELCGIESCYITTVHSYTGDQRLHDSPHKDLRRARAAAQSIIPTTTGAAKALTKVFPHLAEVMGGCGMRVPVPDGSLTDITCVVRKSTTVQDINAYFFNASQVKMQGVLEYTEDPIVSTDVIGNTHSCVFDAKLTSVIGTMVKVVGWYDNEVGYSSRLVDAIYRMQAIRG